jgi:CHAD domain-containing protein
MAFRLKRSEALPDGVRRIVREEIDVAVSELRAAEVDLQNAVHQVRKRCKRLRGLLRLVRPALGKRYAIENKRFRDAGRGLSELRDADALREALDSLQKCCKHGKAGKALFAMRHAAERRRAERSFEKSVIAVRLQNVNELLVDSRNELDAWKFSRSGWRGIGGGLHASYEGGRKALATVATAIPSDAELHQLRKRVKDHWYHMRLLEGAWPVVMEARSRGIKTLTDLLGDDHDLVVVQRAIEDSPELLGDPDMNDVLARVIIQRRDELQADAIRLAHRVYSEEADALVARLRVYWKIWRRR